MFTIPEVTAESTTPVATGGSMAKRFRVEIASWIALASGLILWFLLNGIPDGRVSGILGVITADILILFAVPGLVSMVTWYLSRRSQHAATTAFVVALVVLMAVVQLGKLRMAHAVTSFPTGQTPVNQPETGHESSDAEVNRLRAKVRELEDRLLTVEVRSIGSQLGIEPLTARLRPQIDPSRPSYVAVDTVNGTLFVSCKSVEPYLTGYRLTLSVGNPYAMTFNGGTIHIVHGPKQPIAPDLVDATVDAHAKDKWIAAQAQWSQRTRTADIPFAENLQPASWTNVSVSLLNTTAPELEYMTISIDTSTISLHAANK